jgi:hypothetical protein
MIIVEFITCIDQTRTAIIFEIAKMKIEVGECVEKAP